MDLNCLCLTARRTARVLTRMYEDEMRPSGLTPAQFGLLSNLSVRPGLTQVELTTLVDADQTTLSRSLKLLTTQKLIRSSRSGEDARQTIYTLTKSGHIRFREATSCWLRAQQRMRNKLGTDFDTAMALLRRVAEAA